MSIPDPIQQNASSLVRGYSPDWNANLTDKAGFAKAGQVVKNLTGKMFANFARLLKGVKVDNAAIIAKVQEPLSKVRVLSKDAETLESLHAELLTIQASKAAWVELQKLGLGNTDPHLADAWENLEKDVKAKIQEKSESILGEMERLQTKFENLPFDPCDPDAVQAYSEAIKAKLEGVADAAERKKIIDEEMKPLERCRQIRSEAFC